MAVYTNIDNPGLFFNTVLYTGDGNAGRTVTGVGFQPQWLWIKERSSTSTHSLTDIIRGANERLQSTATDAEFDTGTDNVRSFDSDGFTLGTGGQVNENTQTYVSWNWLAGGSASSNGDGSITSSVSANTTAGFSIVSYSGASSGGTIGHGLGVKPDIVLIKCRSASANWLFTTDIIDGSKDYLFLNKTNVKNNLTTALPTSSVFTVSGDDDQGENGKTYIAYCFNSVKGYSKFGTYTGNGNSDGAFVYTGFKPAWVIIKETTETRDWYMFDNKRSTFNVVNKNLDANTSDAENTFTFLDITSNGFKLRTTDASVNSSGETYIYMAFAEAPFVTSGTKAAGTAR